MINKIFSLHTKLLKAMANEKRLEIISLLGVKELTVGEIQVMLGMAQANLSQHLQGLRKAKVVTTRREGKKIYYHLAHKNFVSAGNLIREILLDQNKGLPLAGDLSFQLTDVVPQVMDPVCKMWISPKTAAFIYKEKGHKHYFCASGCLKKFKNNPANYVDAN